MCAGICPRDPGVSSQWTVHQNQEVHWKSSFFAMLHVYRIYGEGGGGGSVEFARFPELFHGNKLEQRWGSVGMLGFCRNTNTFYSAKCPSFHIPLASFTL